MKRAVVVLALLCAITLTASCYTQQTTEHEKEIENNQHPSTNSPGAVFAVCHLNTTLHKDNGDPQDGKDEVDRKLAKYTGELAEYTRQLAVYTREVSIFTFLLVVVGGVQANFLYGQAKSLIHHSEHLEGLVKVLMDAERAWVVEKIYFPDRIPPQSEGVLLVGCEFKNMGKQPAIIRGIQTRFRATSEPLEPTPIYNGLAFMPDSEINGRLLSPNEPLEVTCDFEGMNLTDEEIEQISRKTLNLYVYGIVKYESVGLEASTQFCYQWHDPKIGLSFEGERARFRKHGPAAYNAVTEARKQEQDA